MTKTRELATVLLISPGAAAGEWTAELDGADEPARATVVEAPEDAARALRDPTDLVVVWDDAEGRRARRAAALLLEARSPVPLVVVAHPDAAVDAVPESAMAILGPARSHRLAAELRRALAVAESEMRVALSERIAHDLSNLLAPIPLALQLLRQPGPDGPPASTVEAIDVSARRAMTAVKELSALSTAPDRAPVRVGARHLMILAARAWMEGEPRIGVVTEYPPDLGHVRVRAVPLARLLWSCARRELDRAGDSGEGDLVFLGRNLPGEVELRIGWVGSAGGESEPLAERRVRAAQSDPEARASALAEAAAVAGGTCETLVSEGEPAGFRLRLPVHDP